MAVDYSSPPPAYVQRGANALALLQAADCITTQAIIRNGGYEMNPIAEGLGASKSLPLCLAETAALNFVIRRADSKLIVTLGLLVETAAVINNVGVLNGMAPAPPPSSGIMMKVRF